MPKLKKNALSPKKKPVKPKRKKRPLARWPSPKRDQLWLHSTGKHSRRLWLMPLKFKELQWNLKRKRLPCKKQNFRE
jgi:hypothetical protein